MRWGNGWYLGHTLSSWFGPEWFRRLRPARRGMLDDRGACLREQRSNPLTSKQKAPRGPIFRFRDGRIRPWTTTAALGFWRSIPPWHAPVPARSSVSGSARRRVGLDRCVLGGRPKARATASGSGSGSGLRHRCGVRDRRRGLDGLSCGWRGAGLSGEHYGLSRGCGAIARGGNFGYRGEAGSGAPYIHTSAVTGATQSGAASVHPRHETGCASVGAPQVVSIPLGARHRSIGLTSSSSMRRPRPTRGDGGALLRAALGAASIPSASRPSAGFDRIGRSSPRARCPHSSSMSSIQGRASHRRSTAEAAANRLPARRGPRWNRVGIPLIGGDQSIAIPPSIRIDRP